MVIKISLSEEEVECLDTCRSYVNFEMDDILKTSDEEFQEREMERMDYLLELRDILHRIIEVAENKRMIEEDMIRHYQRKAVIQEE